MMLFVGRVVMLVVTVFMLHALTPQYAQTESAVAGTPAINCSHSTYSTASSTRMLAAASTMSDVECLRHVRQVSLNKLTYYRNNRWMLSSSYKKWWHIPSETRRNIARKARSEVRLYTTVLDRVSTRIEVLVGPSWCAGITGNRGLGCRMAYRYWPSESEWEALDVLWQRESHWDTHADNPKSDACGIPQILNNCSYGYDPAVQIGAGLVYIVKRKDERTPIGALAHSNKYHWY